MLSKMSKEQTNRDDQFLWCISRRNAYLSARESGLFARSKSCSNMESNLYCFASALCKFLGKGRQKRLNVLLIGPTNCGKSFLLNPHELIYKTFMNPTTGKYAWIGLDEYEVAYLNDFRWLPELDWSDVFLLLDGQTVHLPKPKNAFTTDLCIPKENTIPIFATSKGSIEFLGRYNSCDERENDMMSCRWNTFKLGLKFHSVNARAFQHVVVVSAI